MKLTYHTMHDRRGVLLLLVLSMLTLFLMMGATLLVVATRARTASRSFEAAMSQPEVSPVVPRAVLDEALLLLIRGSKVAAVNAILTESLLGDMYSTDDNRVPFRDEPYDAFDGSNVFLTEIGEDGTVSRSAFQGTRTTEVDNDADGTADGVWLPNLHPTMSSTNGGSLSFRVSYLVLDLDGRVNVNAHGGGGAPAGPGMVDGSSLPAFGANGWNLIQQGGAAANAPDVEALRKPPVLGQDIAGRGGLVYDLRLDREAPRPATLTGADPQNPFTLGELERVLRPFDRDWSTLPPRLVSFLTDLDNSARRTVTTDSWDVTYKTGPAAPAANPPEVKFDLSQPLGKEQFANELYAAISANSIAGNTAATAQWCANVAEFREPASAAASMEIGGHPPVTGVKPGMNAALGTWTGGFESVADLLGVPKGSQSEIQTILDNPPSVLASLAAERPVILEAVHVPSRFTATITQDPNREPGRVNVNTCSEDVWNAVCGPDCPPKPAGAKQSLWQAIEGVIYTNPGYITPDVRALDRVRANRLGSSATVRSNVFAIWITVEVKDSALTASDPMCYRLFAIVDRSIPVNYVAGENKNVHETIRLKRFLK